MARLIYVMTTDPRCLQGISSDKDSNIIFEADDDEAVILEHDALRYRFFIADNASRPMTLDLSKKSILVDLINLGISISDDLPLYLIVKKSVTTKPAISLALSDDHGNVYAKTDLFVEEQHAMYQRYKDTPFFIHSALAVLAEKGICFEADETSLNRIEDWISAALLGVEKHSFGWTELLPDNGPKLVN